MQTFCQRIARLRGGLIMATKKPATGTSNPTSGTVGVPPAKTPRTEIKDIPPSDTPLSEEELRKVKGGRMGLGDEEAKKDLGPG
jgi:hypothetical protein